MPIIVSEIKSSLSDGKDVIFNKALKSLKLSYKDVSSIEVYKTSLDARKRDNIHFVNSV